MTKRVFEYLKFWEIPETGSYWSNLDGRDSIYNYGSMEDALDDGWELMQVVCIDQNLVYFLRRGFGLEREKDYLKGNDYFKNFK